MAIDSSGNVQRVDLNKLMHKIIALLPEDVTPQQHSLMMSIMSDFALVAGIVGALQLTAGHVFLQHSKGNTDVADLFYDTLLSIIIPEEVTRRIMK